VFVNSAILMSTGLIARTRSIVTNALASTLGGGAIAALAFTLKLTEPLERAAFTGARMFMFSRTARMFVEQDRRGLGRLYETGLRVSFLLVAPVVWWVVMNSEFIVGVLFARGVFTPQMSALVAGALIAMVPSVLFMGVGQLLSNAFFAMDRVRAPAVVMPCGMLVYVAFAVALVEPLGTQGLALATSVTALATFSALFIWLSFTLDELHLGRTALNLFTYLAASGAIMGAVTLGLTALELPAWGVAVAGAPLGAGAYLAVLWGARDRACLGMQRFARDVLAGNAPA
jgi:peptidoglycan biosynthesis protein MviN/MurJ (putative lipid II flippase)